MRLTPDATGEEVLAVARGVARAFRPRGALDTADYVSIGVLAFYAHRETWASRARDFAAYAWRCMHRAMLQAVRSEDRHHQAPPVVQDRDLSSVPSTRHEANRALEPATGSASPIRHRRLAARRAHNQTYYLRHVGGRACEVCGTLVERGHGARRCEAHLTAPARVAVAWRAQQKSQRWRPGVLVGAPGEVLVHQGLHGVRAPRQRAG